MSARILSPVSAQHDARVPTFIAYYREPANLLFGTCCFVHSIQCEDIRLTGNTVDRFSEITTNSAVELVVIFPGGTEPIEVEQRSGPPLPLQRSCDHCGSLLNLIFPPCRCSFMSAY